MGSVRTVIIGVSVLASVATATAVTSSAQAASEVGQCKRSDLTIHAQLSTPAGGTNFALLHFKNKLQAHSCTTYGYPGVAVLTAAGKQKYQAVRTPSGYAGGLQSGRKAPHITLKPGQEATAVIEAASRRLGGTTCPSYGSILITAPNTYRSADRALRLFTCKSPDVHPLIAGSTGQQS
jgi:hypothetical protein